jgi:hypothetical protein
VAETLKYKIIELLMNNLNEILTITDISKKLKSAYSHAHKFTKELAQENVIQIKKIGRSSAIFLNFSEKTTLAYLILTEYKKRNLWLKKNKWALRVVKKCDDLEKEYLCGIYLKSKVIFIQKSITQTHSQNSNLIKSKKPKKSFKHQEIIFSDQIHLKPELNEGIILFGAENYWTYKGEKTITRGNY